MEKSLTDQIQDKVNDGLKDAFELVIKSRNAYYQEHPDKIPGPAAVDALIRACVTQNSVISGGASLIPGPWGMLAVVPELLVVIKNQIQLIYDIGAAYGRKEMISKELLLGIFINAAGTGAGSLLVVQGGKVLVRRASLQVMQKAVALLGGRITQQALKSAVSKWLPGVGAAAMAAWTGYLTNRIGEKARDIFANHEIENDPDTLDIEPIQPVDVADATASADEQAADSLLEFCKLQILIDLAKIDGTVSDEERQYIEKALESPELSDAQKARLTAALEGKSEALQGIDAVKARPDSVIALLSNMMALAKKDGDLHVAEKLYIKKIGALLGFSESEIDEILSAL